MSPHARSSSPISRSRWALLGAGSIPILTVAVFKLGEAANLFSKRYTLVALLPSANGLRVGGSVTVAGPIDPVTGMVVSLDVLDRVLQREVMDRFDHRNINLEVPEFADGKLVPTGENLARFILERVQLGLGDTARVSTVTVAEDESLSATVRAG